MPVLKVEHFACNVSDPAGMAAWYVEHSGMRILRRNAAAGARPGRLHVGSLLPKPSPQRAIHLH